MQLLVAFVALLIILVIVVWLTFNLLGLLFTLVMAAIVGVVADRIVPGELPYGWLGAIVAGLAGSWLGGLILGDFGPQIFGIEVIPALLGAIILAFVAEFAFSRTRGRALR